MVGWTPFSRNIFHATVFPEGLFIPHLTDMAASPGQGEKTYEKEVLNQVEAAFDR